MFENKIKFKIDLIAEYEGKPLLNTHIAELLRLVDIEGSILAACRILGMPYSRAWEAIARIERALGIKIVEAKRGGSKGGGTKLTREGKNIVRLFFEELSKVSIAPHISGKPKLPELTIMGSHDPVLEIIIDILKTRKNIKDVEVSWIGSSGGLASLMLNEADIAGVHLYDPETKTYNIPYLKKYWLEDKVVIIRGYLRELVFTYNPKVEFNSIRDLFEKKLRIINRNLGSGTRTLLEYLFRKEAEKLKIHQREIAERIRGYNNEVKTHYEVAKNIVEGKADVGLVLRYIAEQYGLKGSHVCWENYDFAIRINKLNKNIVKNFISILKSREVRKTIINMPGYRVDNKIGEIVYQAL